MKCTPFSLETQSKIRAYMYMIEACKRGYRRNIYRVVNNGLFYKNEVDKVIVIDSFYKAFKSLIKNKNSTIESFVDTLLDGFYQLTI